MRGETMSILLLYLRELNMEMLKKTRDLDSCRCVKTIRASTTSWPNHSDHQSKCPELNDVTNAFQLIDGSVILQSKTEVTPYTHTLIITYFKVNFKGFLTFFSIGESLSMVYN